MPDTLIPTIIDVEASGFGQGSYPIEIGVALPDGQTACFLIKPHVEWQHWDGAGEKAHGISRKILETQGKSLNEVAQALNTLLAGKTVYSDAWSFDSSWIALLYHKAELPQMFKIAQLQTLFQELHYELWHPVHEQVRRDLNITRHRASSDAYLIQQTFLKSTLISRGRAQSQGS